MVYVSVAVYNINENNSLWKHDYDIG